MKARILILRGRRSCIPSPMIGGSSHLNKRKYQLRRLPPQRELVPDAHSKQQTPGLTSFCRQSGRYLRPSVASFTTLLPAPGSSPGWPGS